MWCLSTYGKVQDLSHSLTVFQAATISDLFFFLSFYLSSISSDILICCLGVCLQLFSTIYIYIYIYFFFFLMDWPTKRNSYFFCTILKVYSLKSFSPQLKPQTIEAHTSYQILAIFFFFFLSYFFIIIFSLMSFPLYIYQWKWKGPFILLS